MPEPKTDLFRGQRVCVTTGPLTGRSGTVVSDSDRRYYDGMAWVELDSEPREDLRHYDIGHPRSRWVLLNPEEARDA